MLRAASSASSSPAAGVGAELRPPVAAHTRSLTRHTIRAITNVRTWIIRHALHNTHEITSTRHSSSSSSSSTARTCPLMSGCAADELDGSCVCDDA
jgi:hypothetical protein